MASSTCRLSRRMPSSHWRCPDINEGSVPCLGSGRGTSDRPPVGTRSGFARVERFPSRVGVEEQGLEFLEAVERVLDLRRGPCPGTPREGPAGAVRRVGGGAAERFCRSQSSYPPMNSCTRPSPSNTSVLVTTWSMKARSWLTRSRVPCHVESRSSSSSSVSMSRSLVGSSSTSTLTARVNRRAHQQEPVPLAARQCLDGGERAFRSMERAFK